MEDFYGIVSWFSGLFATIALLRHPVTGEYQEHSPQPSERERRRIERSFYRFELYCKCLPGGNRGEETDNQ